MIYSNRNCLCKSNSFVALVEVGIVFLDERVTKDERVGQLRRQVHGHESDGALSLAKGGDLEDVVFTLQDIAISTNDELEGWGGGNLIAVDRFRVVPVSQDLVNMLFWSNNDGSACVNNSFKSLNSNRLAADLQIVNADEPVRGVKQWIVFKGRGSVSRINSSQNQLRSLLSGLARKEERE